MTRFFRSKSYAGSPPPTTTFFEGVDSLYQDYSYFNNNNNNNNPITTPFISPDRRHNHQPQASSFTILSLLLAGLRKSIVTCTVDESDDASSDASSLDIGSPTDVQHVSHVTFDPFDGFHGLPVELQPDVPRKPPSASISAFGVSVESMQCSFDGRGNSVPTILLVMQRRLYAGGGLQAEGIFRINAENSQEEEVREQLNKGSVPHGIDVHCLAGLIKAWFRELPRGVLDSLTPEQVMHCNTEDECTALAKSLPQTEAALLDWTVNLMADVVTYEPHNKMNSHNIAVVFAPNMTKMADPLTALIHAAQVMKFLKTLVNKTLRQREEPSYEMCSCGDNIVLENTDSLEKVASGTDDNFWSLTRKSKPVLGCGYMPEKNSQVNHRSKQEVEVAVGRWRWWR